MNSNIGVSDDHIIQIIPTPDHTTNQSHEQTPIAASTNSLAPKHYIIGVNELTPEELDSLKEELERHIGHRDWLKSKSIIDKCPDMVRIPLDHDRDRALHLATSEGRLEIVKELVNRMNPKDMRIPNSNGNTALHLAASEGSLEIVKELVNRMSPKDMRIRNSNGNTALHLAASEGSLEIVKELVNRMSPKDMQIPNFDGNTALHLATSEGRLEIVKELVNRMSPKDMLKPNLYGNTALHLATSEGSLEIVKELVNRTSPKDMQIPNFDGNTALHLATSEGRLEIVKELVNRMSPEDMRIPTFDGNTALHLATSEGRLEIVKELVNRMSLEDLRTPKFDGNTALHLAAIYNNLEIVKELINRMNSEDMLIPNSNGNTALHLATSEGRLAIVKELVKRMSPEDRLIRDSDGNTALHLATIYVNLEIVKELANRTNLEDMLIPNSNGNTALHLAASEGSLEIVKELVYHMRPEDMLIPNSNGNTALHLAASEDSLVIVKELVNRMRPEDMLIPNSYGDRALHLAAKYDRLEIVKELVNCMSPEDMLIPNSYGMLPVHLAASYGHRRIVDILSSQEVLDKMDFKDIERLFLMTIKFDMFDSALRLFEKHPTTLAIARNEEDVTVVRMLEEKPRGQSAVYDRLFGEVSTLVETLEKKREDAIKSGNVEAVKMLIDENPELVTYRDQRNGWNLLHSVVLYFRHEKMFLGITKGLERRILRAVDNEGNNILHLAARRPPVEFEELSSLRASIQMQRELAWFKFVEAHVPGHGELRTILNQMRKRPIDVFYDEHKKLSEEIKETAKGIAESGMLVSALVATVAFAAALTVPGDKTNAWFTVFILTNAVALFTSSASLLSFLSNFTSSRFAQSDFVISLHPSLTFGRTLLIISVAAMVVAFTAASFLIFDHTSKWVSYAVASMGLFPILLFLLFQFRFFDKHLWSRYYRLSKQDKLVTELQTLA